MGYSDARILVSGAAGFLGYNLCKRLLSEGCHVIGIDNMKTGVPGHVTELLSNRRFSFRLHDVTDPIDLDVNQIYNLACPASPPAYQADPIHTFMTSILGARNLLELARAKDARILQASTSEVYGDPVQHPQLETYCGNVKSMGPRACYDEGKRGAETLFFEYNHIHDVDIRVARIFNTYGPGMRPDDGRVVSNFILQALNGDDITLYGDGSFTRSLCYVDDLIDGLIRLMNHESPCLDPINLGNPREMSVLAIAETVLKKTGSKSRIIQLPEAADDPKQRCPDIGRAYQKLDWAPKVAFEDGLTPTIDYFRRV